MFATSTVFFFSIVFLGVIAKGWVRMLDLLFYNYLEAFEEVLSDD